MAKRKAVKIACTGADTLPIDELVDFQGRMKQISEENLTRLKDSIIDHGFTAPVFVWIGPKEQQFILDGHQRLKATLALREDGYDVPEIPVDYIHAKSKKDAAERLLHIASQYGEVDLSGLEEFAIEHGLQLDELDLRLVDTQIDLSETQVDLSGFFQDDNSPGSRAKTIECPHCGETIEL